MHVLSTNIGAPATLEWQGETIISGIRKRHVNGIGIRTFFVEGDTVGDQRVHGGANKAVYGYPSEHYEFWREEFPDMEMPWGTFGENLTTSGMLEPDVMIGSVYRIGSAVLKVTQPRMPCFKLGIVFGTQEMIRRFLHSRKSGFYFTVVKEGAITPGDRITLEEPGDSGRTIVDVVNERVARAGA